MQIKVLLAELERAVFSIPFLVGIVGTVAVFFLGSADMWFVAEEMLENGLDWQYELSMLHKGAMSEEFIFFAPLLSVIPAGTSVLTELKTGMLKSYLPRCGRKNYMFSKVFVAVITGGGSLSAGYMLAAWVMGLIYRPMEKPPVEDFKSLWSLSLAQCLVLFFVGAFFALMGSILGLLFGNRYMVYGGAFMICYLMIIATSRYLTSVYVLNPREWMDLEHYWERGYLGCAAFLLELCVILSLLYGHVIWKKIGKGAML